MMGVGVPHQGSRAEFRLLRGVSTGHARFDERFSVIIHVQLLGFIQREIGREAFECDDDVIKRAHVSRSSDQQATTPERSQIGCFVPPV